MFMLYALPVGLVAGLALGGRIQGLADARFRFTPVFLLGLLIQVALFSTPLGETAWARSAGPAVYVGTMVLILAALTANLQGRGSQLAVAGALCNLAVIVANGGYMPVSADAVRRTHGEAAVLELGQEGPLTNVRLMDERTRLPFLGDIISLPPSLPSSNVASVGDFILAAGVALWLVELMRAAGGALRRQDEALYLCGGLPWHGTLALSPTALHFSGRWGSVEIPLGAIQGIRVATPDPAAPAMVLPVSHSLSGSGQQDEAIVLTVQDDGDPAPRRAVLAGLRDAEGWLHDILARQDHFPTAPTLALRAA